ncbi:MAG: orotidine-5'-phosphate decarboxylase [Phycisphaerales bacterium]|nr:MAG: orotidine-5'-phosphate decarboxylase [Phycisphaerales bacterium]
MVSTHFADQLMQAIQAKNAPVCVGIDPVYDRLPADIAEQKDMNDATDSASAIDAILEFSRRVIRIVSPLVPAVKINSAFFERYYSEGVEAYYDLVQEAAELDLLVIGDVKRADIGSSSAPYARAHLANPAFANLDDLVAPDAVTVNPYFGFDALRPFVDVCREEAKGIFALVRTSNESSMEVQGLTLEGGMTVSDRVATLVNQWAGDDGLIGSSGYSCIGAVVSPHDRDETIKLRALMPNCILLVPGYGAQGRTAEDIAPCFKDDGTGALINASRSVLYAYENMEYIERFASEWDRCVEQACKDLIADVRRVVNP